MRKWKLPGPPALPAAALHILPCPDGRRVASAGEQGEGRGASGKGSQASGHGEDGWGIRVRGQVQIEAVPGYEERTEGLGIGIVAERCSGGEDTEVESAYVKKKDYTLEQQVFRSTKRL